MDLNNNITLTKNDNYNILIGKDAGIDFVTETFQLVINTSDGTSYRRQMKDIQEYNDTLAMINYLLNLYSTNKIEFGTPKNDIITPQTTGLENTFIGQEASAINTTGTKSTGFGKIFGKK